MYTPTQQVLELKNQLTERGTWQDMLEFMNAVSLLGAIALAFRDWRMALLLVGCLCMHLTQLYMFLGHKRKAFMEWTMVTLILDIIVIGTLWGVQQGLITSLVYTDQPFLVDSYTANIIKLAVMGGAFFVDLLRVRQYWTFETQDENEILLLKAAQKMLNKQALDMPQQRSNQYLYGGRRAV